MFLPVFYISNIVVLCYNCKKYATRGLKMDQINLKDRINRLFDDFTEKFLLPDKSFSIT